VIILNEFELPDPGKRKATFGRPGFLVSSQPLRLSTGLRKLAQMTQKHFIAGIVLYDGEHLLHFGECMLAVPISYLWLA
jgi:hypothetical protein